MSNTWKKLWEKQEGRCFWCNCEMIKGPHPKGARQPDRLATFDHIKPLSKGGHWHIKNLCLACHWCNQAKADRIV